LAVGPHFDRALADATAASLTRQASPLPRGIVLRAEVRQQEDGPDGAYLVLAPWRAATQVAVRSDDLLAPGAKAAARDRKAPAEGTWITLAGAILSRFDTGKEQGLAVLPLEWSPVAAPPPAPPRGPPPGPPPGGAVPPGDRQ
jgi:hypothetical protein